ncbi:MULTISPECIES: DNA primase [Sphingomonas]|uniref:DNA primase n=1 Tax=Sphingomonas TaxID=13687 RepID=UPI000834CC5F|nr:DNA primase [Sphingomonas sp. CCH10-B3]
MTLTPAFLDELRARTVLSTLVGKSMKLTKAGREYKGCCPFHQEKTPSFYVNDEKGFYHCFGCSAHGDAIRWMTDQRGLPFIDAVKELAAAAGLDMPEQDRASVVRAERAKGLHDVMQAAADWFSAQLGGIEGSEARTLLERRGIRPETAKAFGMGYAPDARGKLRTALKEFGDAMLVEAGLLIQVDDKEPYDRFRGRLMIPIRDPRGRVIAFGGRVIGSGEPKYLNSPDTPLFDKGRTLYNLDRAAPASRKANRVIVVEGYMDVIALAQAGFDEAVAPLGTALTEAQLERLWRLSDVPVLCFDGDGAGQRAAIRAAHRALPMLAPGRSLAFVTLPPGQDPDDVIRASGAAAMDKLLGETQPLVDRLWADELAAQPLATPEERAGLKARLGERAAAIVDANVGQEYRAEFRRRFDAHFAPAPRVWNAPRAASGPRSAKWRPAAPIGGDHPKAQAIRQSGIDPALAKPVLAGLIRHPGEIARHIEVIGALKFSGGALGALFAAMVDAVVADPALDSDALRTILATSGFDPIVRDLLRADATPYSFTRKEIDPDRARADLDEAIAILAARPEVDSALQEATLAAMRFEDGAWERQAALVIERQALEARLANLCQANEDDRTDGRTTGLEDS